MGKSGNSVPVRLRFGVVPEGGVALWVLFWRAGI